MQDKVLEILAGAPGWLTASDVAKKGKFRSVANVGLCLKHLGDRVASRKSPARKSPARKSPARKNQSTGQPLVEWRHADKAFDTGSEPASTKSESICSKVVDAPSDPITRRAPVKNFTQPAHDNEISDLRAQLKLAEQQRDDHYDRFCQAERATENWLNLAGEFECKSVPELRVFINAAGERINELKAKNNEAASENIRWLAMAKEYHCNSIDGLRTMIAAFQNAERQWEVAMMAAVGEDGTGSVTTAIDGLKQRIADLESAVDLAQQTIHTMELEAEQSKDVKDAAVGYLVRVPKRKPRLCVKPENAREAALSGARVYGRADVLALVPVGKAVRGAEWKDSA